MNYTLHQLKVFTEVVKQESITRASEKLHMTQPAVSIQLKNLQDQFHIPLTEIIGRKLYITDFGKELATIANSILAATEEINQRMLARKGLLTGKIRFSIVSTGKYIMPYYLSSFNKRHPDVELALDVTNRSQVIKSLQENTTDFALVSILPDQLLLDEELLMPNALWLVASSHLPVNRNKQTLDLSILKETPVIYREKGSGTRIVMEEYMHREHLQPNVKLELTSTEAIKQAVIAGLGISILSIHSLRRELETGVVKLLPVKGFPLYSHWRLVWLKGKKFSPATSTFLHLIQAQKRLIFDEHFVWTKKYIEDFNLRS